MYIQLVFQRVFAHFSAGKVCVTKAKVTKALAPNPVSLSASIYILTFLRQFINN